MKYRYIFLLLFVILVLFLFGFALTNQPDKTEITMKINTSNISEKQRSTILSQNEVVIKKRLESYGVSSISIRENSQNNSTDVIIDIPKSNEIKQIITVLTTNPSIEFFSLKPGISQAKSKADITPSNIDSTDIQKASIGTIPVTIPQTKTMTILLTFTPRGLLKFSQLASQNYQKPVYIFIDGSLVSAPTIGFKSTDGKIANPIEIETRFTNVEANELISQINSGEVPIPATSIQTKSFGYTLSKEICIGVIVVDLILLVLLLIYTFLIHNSSKIN